MGQGEKEGSNGTGPERWSARRKTEAVMRLMRGEGLDELSREQEVPAHRLAEWREAFLAGGQAALKSRPTTAADDALRKAQAKIGELTMKLELYEKKDELLARARRSKR